MHERSIGRWMDTIVSDIMWLVLLLGQGAERFLTHGSEMRMRFIELGIGPTAPTSPLLAVLTLNANLPVLLSSSNLFLIRDLGYIL